MKTTFHTIVIGTGCAGYHAAERLYKLGVTDIAILTEGRLMGTSRNTGSDKQTYYKLSLCGDDGDSVRELASTLFAGGAVNGDTAFCEATYSVRCFMHLVELGVPFPTNELGEYVGYKTDHDPRSRATSCGPLTSQKMTQVLEQEVERLGIPLLDGYRAVKLLTDENGIVGVAALDTRGFPTVFTCANVVLATGGPAGVYARTVYPESQSGATGLALEAGAKATNLDQWQYGLASTAFRWNVSGTYQQVLPRYISVDAEGNEYEFLPNAFGNAAEALDMVFLKGYQWPFDSAKLNGSSRVDLFVEEEIRKGRRVYMDFCHNPQGLEEGFAALGAEAKQYLENSEALFGTPIERLQKMNAAAIQLYADHGIDITREPLEVAVCAQHCNGGVAVDANWQSTVLGLYVVGEAAGTFGVARPGGSALNAAMVGSLRAAEHIAAANRSIPKNAAAYTLPNIRRGESSVAAWRESFCTRMSRVAAFDRNISEMQTLFTEATALRDSFFETMTATGPSELISVFLFYDILCTQCAVLSAMLCSGQKIGSHGSALVDKKPPLPFSAPRDTQTITQGEESYLSPVRPLPNPDTWFERVWRAQQNK